MSELTNTEYWTEIKRIAAELASDSMREQQNDRDLAEQHIYDSMLHDYIDSHQWVIYYSYNLDVIKHSDNEDYMTDNFGNDYAGDVLANSGINGLHMTIAYWCMYADVQEYITEALDALEEAV